MQLVYSNGTLPAVQVQAIMPRLKVQELSRSPVLMSHHRTLHRIIVRSAKLLWPLMASDAPIGVSAAHATASAKISISD